MYPHGIDQNNIYTERLFCGAPPTNIEEYITDLTDANSTIPKFFLKPYKLAHLLYEGLDKWNIENEYLWRIFCAAHKNMASGKGEQIDLLIRQTLAKNTDRDQNISTDKPLSETNSETHLADVSELWEDPAIRFPPIERRTVTVKIMSTRDGTINPRILSEEPCLDDAILEEDMDMHIPPIEKYTVKVKVKSIKDGNLRVR